MIESEDLVQEERARKAAVRKSKMDADLDAESADLQEKKGVSKYRAGAGSNITGAMTGSSDCGRTRLGLGLDGSTQGQGW